SSAIMANRIRGRRVELPLGTRFLAEYLREIEMYPAARPPYKSVACAGTNPTRTCEFHGYSLQKRGYPPHIPGRPTAPKDPTNPAGFDRGATLAEIARHFPCPSSKSAFRPDRAGHWSSPLSKLPPFATHY